MSLRVGVAADHGGFALKEHLVVMLREAGHEVIDFGDGPPASDSFVDAFISSCFVHIRKPDADIFRLALDVAQTPARQVVYVENTPMFVRVAEGLGIRSILHTDYKSTCAKMAAFGLRNK